MKDNNYYRQMRIEDAKETIKDVGMLVAMETVGWIFSGLECAAVVLALMAAAAGSI